MTCYTFGSCMNKCSKGLQENILVAVLYYLVYFSSR
uniref:Uncharacterized protein n=1 Tax=Rhizophora mucronata TaxID=61149 RepID=A0A2P2Q4S6_RHIMU